ncbi:hypothetical protein Tco_1203885 [Tanacetum coccineum]
MFAYLRSYRDFCNLQTGWKMVEAMGLLFGGRVVRIHVLLDSSALSVMCGGGGGGGMFEGVVFGVCKGLSSVVDDDKFSDVGDDAGSVIGVTCVGVRKSDGVVVVVVVEETCELETLMLLPSIKDVCVSSLSGILIWGIKARSLVDDAIILE